MPVVSADDAVVHEMHGSVFASYAAPARGSRELCAWRLEVPGGARGVAHSVSREEVLLVLSGTLRVTLGASPSDTESVLADDAPGAGTARSDVGGLRASSTRTSSSAASDMAGSGAETAGSGAGSASLASASAASDTAGSDTAGSDAGGSGAGAASLASAGDVIVVPAGAVLRLDNAGADRASAWVTTSVGLEGTLPDGSRISPPWVR